MPLSPPDMTRKDYVRRQRRVDAIQKAIPKERFAAFRDEKGRKGRFDMEQLHPLERAPMLREAEAISKARPARYYFDLDPSEESGNFERFSNDRAAFEARNLHLARKSRQLLPDLTEDEIFLIRFYGRYAIPLNRALRIGKGTRGIYRPKESYDTRFYHDIIQRYRSDIQTYIKGSDYTGDYGDWFWSEESEDLAYDYMFANAKLSKIIRSLLNNTIDRYSDRHPKTGHFYRISRALEDVYSAAAPSRFVGEEDVSREFRINPGDIISDWAMLSAARSFDSILFEYSYEGERASNPVHIDRNEEEIIFVIKNTPALKYIDISGHKFLKQQAMFNSDEVLIKSNTRFRVLAIQDKPAQYPRRVVHLEPVEDYYENEIVRNMYDGGVVLGDEI